LLSAHPHDERQLFGRSLHPDRSFQPDGARTVSCPNQAHERMMARVFQALKERSERSRLERQLDCQPINQTHDSRRCQIGRLAYHSHPDIFQDVLAEQPVL